MKKFCSFLLTLFCYYFLTAQIPSTGNVLWLKADNGVYTNTSGAAAINGQLVQVWADQSGNGNNFDQPTSIKRPQYVANVLCGKPVLRFTISRGTYMQSPFKLSGAKSIFLAFVLPSLYNSGETLLSIKGSGDVFTEIVGTDFSGYKPMSYIQDLASTSSSSPTLNVMPARGNSASFSTSGNLFSVVYDGSSNTSSAAYTAKYDGSSATISSSGNFGRKQEDTTSIGARVPQQNINYFTGDIAEIIVYNRVLSGAEVSQVENYLIGKYGLVGTCVTLNSGINSFAVNQIKEGVLLSWKFSDPVVPGEFYVQQSEDGKNFTTVGIKKTEATLARAETYSFLHSNVKEGVYYYRIAVPNHGQYVYSEIKKIVIKGPANARLFVFPNPATNFISLYAEKNEKVSVTIFSNTGQFIQSIITKTNEPIYLHSLKPGLYIINARTSNTVYTGKLVIK